MALAKARAPNRWPYNLIAAEASTGGSLTSRGARGLPSRIGQGDTMSDLAEQTLSHPFVIRVDGECRGQMLLALLDDYRLMGEGNAGAVLDRVALDVVLAAVFGGLFL